MATYLTSGNDVHTADGGEIVYAREGNDQIHIVHVDDSDVLGYDFDYFAPAEVYGEQGNDYIVSYGWGDRLYGDSGDDTLIGGGGADMLNGGTGNDEIWTGTSGNNTDDDQGDVAWAGAGDDTVYLQNAANNDTIRGEDGYDILYLYNGSGHLSQFSLVAGGSNGGLLASGFEELNYYGGNGFEVIEGGNNDDHILGGGGTDIISGLGGEDLLHGEAGADIVNGGLGDDAIWGGSEDDVLNGGDGGDILLGETGNDKLNDGNGNDAVSGGDGSDTIRTGMGTDSANGGDGNDVIREEGSDIGYITFMGIKVPVVGGDTLSGGADDDDIQGGSGNDKIDGGFDDDIVNGGSGVDELTGGGGRDRFQFSALTDSGTGLLRDSITDFTVTPGSGFAVTDRIDVSAIDASENLGGAQNFDFIGTAGFSAEGQVRVVQQGANAVIQLNTLGNGGAEAAIILVNFDSTALTFVDFIL
jgi:Ca2+-binding RTX toxin-like protein